MISAGTFNITSCTFNCLNICPLVVFAGDACQQQPLETMDRQITPIPCRNSVHLKYTLYR